MVISKFRHVTFGYTYSNKSVLFFFFKHRQVLVTCGIPIQDPYSPYCITNGAIRPKLISVHSLMQGRKIKRGGDWAMAELCRELSLINTDNCHGNERA